MALSGLPVLYNKGKFNNTFLVLTKVDKNKICGFKIEYNLLIRRFVVQTFVTLAKLQINK